MSTEVVKVNKDLEERRRQRIEERVERDRVRRVRSIINDKQTIINK
jgi:hypothetical protein